MTPAKRIGKYPVIREIGSGTMGKVFEGFDPDTGEKVAIKTLRAEHLADAEADSAGARFGREAQVGLRLQHPHIVAVRDYGEQGRIRYIVMEFVKGRELRQLLRERGRLRLDEAVAVLHQLLAALDCSHRHGVVHRDIKPANLMVVEPLHVKVMDFGVARLEGAAFTQVGTLLGTLSYMSPEQMAGETVDARTDLWAAGVILYELLSGRVPFTAPTTLEVMRQAAQQPHTPVHTLLPELPAALDAVLDRALAKQREDRYASAAAFAHALGLAAAATATDVELDLPPAPVAAVDLPLEAGDDDPVTLIRPRPPAGGGRQSS